MDEEIIELYEHYETCRKVADELGISVHKVRDTLIKHGIPRTHRHPKPEPKYHCPTYCAVDVDEAVRLYEEGNSTTKIGEMLGCSWMTINRRLKAAGVDIRRVGINRIDISLEDVIPLIDTGLSQEEAAKRLGCSVATVKSRLHEAGIKRKERPKNIVLPMDEIAALFDGGETLAAIGDAFGCSRETIKRRLKAMGYEFEPRQATEQRGERRVSNHRDKAKLYGVEYDGTINWRSLSERLGHCNCEICGEPCEPTDRRWGDMGPFYPSVDCIVPMSKGGSYTWGNVQLAHCICNMLKSNRDNQPDTRKAVARYA